jgi:hypothetical protein
MAVVLADAGAAILRAEEAKRRRLEEQYAKYREALALWEPYEGVMPTRAINAFAHRGISPGQAAGLSDKTILSYRNIGRGTLARIRSVFSEPAPKACPMCGTVLA